ncbi:MAG: hypothetical protein KTR15_01315 [Phycisphaeraceae bacterium]|nr:hypothetical protein [Phycisphaeraceae bacterium]
MIRIAIALLVGGGILTFFGYNEHKLASAADSEPQTITAQDLIANGYDDNAHVSVKDFEMITWETIVLTPEDNPNKFEKVWAPMIAFDDPYIEELQALPDNAQTAPPYRGQVALILYSTDISSSGQLDSVAYQDTVQGLVINEIDKLGGEELKELKKSLSIDPDKVIILEHNRKPKGTGTTMLMMVGGVLLMLVGPGMIFLGRNK